MEHVCHTSLKRVIHTSENDDDDDIHTAHVSVSKPREDNVYFLQVYKKD